MKFCYRKRGRQSCYYENLCNIGLVNREKHSDYCFKNLFFIFSVSVFLLNFHCMYTVGVPYMNSLQYNKNIYTVQYCGIINSTVDYFHERIVVCYTVYCHTRLNKFKISFLYFVCMAKKKNVLISDLSNNPLFLFFQVSLFLEL